MYLTEVARKWTPATAPICHAHLELHGSALDISRDLRSTITLQLVKLVHPWGRIRAASVLKASAWHSSCWFSVFSRPMVVPLKSACGTLAGYWLCGTRAMVYTQRYTSSELVSEYFLVHTKYLMFLAVPCSPLLEKWEEVAGDCYSIPHTNEFDSCWRT